jgi:chromosome segregation and condensation protein ScpB
MDSETEQTEKQTRSISEIIAVIEALIFVSDEPLTVKIIADVLEEDRETVQSAIEELSKAV